MIAVALVALVAAALLGVTAVPLALLAVAVVPDSHWAAVLLAAAAVLAALRPKQGRRAALLGLPGAVTAAAAVSHALVVVLVVTGVVLATHEADPDDRPHPVLLLPAASLLLLPGPGAYRAGLLRAGIGAALFLLATRLRPRRRAPAA